MQQKITSSVVGRASWVIADEPVTVAEHPKLKAAIDAHVRT